MENLLNPPSQPQLPPGRAAELAEVTFFSQPPPPDPQLAALKTYAGWFAAIVFAVIASFAAYSWLEASNVIGRLIGENAAKKQVQTLGPLSAVSSRHRPSVPNFITTGAGESNPQVTTTPEANSMEAATQAYTRAGESVDSDNAPANNNKVAKPQAKAKAVASSSAVSINTTSSVSGTLTPLSMPSASEAAVIDQPTNSAELAYVPEAKPVRADLAEAQAAQSKPKKSVIVTQIEPSKGSGTKTVSPVEDFFRRWKKSIKQGVSDRPCTQQEKVLNQCYN